MPNPMKAPRPKGTQIYGVFTDGGFRLFNSKKEALAAARKVRGTVRRRIRGTGAGGFDRSTFATTSTKIADFRKDKTPQLVDLNLGRR